MVKGSRVVITGLGVISSIGIGKDAFWKNLLQGVSGISKVQRFNTSQYGINIGGEIKDFDPARFFDHTSIKRLGRAAQLAIAACQLALDDARLSRTQLSGSVTSVCLGTTMADAQSLETIVDEVISTGKYRRQTVRANSMQYPSFMIVTRIAEALGITGRVFMIPTACAAGNYAISYGNDLIKLGKCDVVLVGGADPFSRTAFTGFGRIFALAPERCQPFDKNRKGIVVGEGAGVLVLESVTHAQSRKARIYAEIAGYGMSADASHMTAPDVAGITNAMKRALSDAGVSPGEIDYISAHGTGTSVNDRVECAAIRNVFGERASSVPVSSIKSMLGHTMGAASALEAITCVMGIHTDSIPPTINYETPDPECQIDCVPNQARHTKVSYCLNNSFAFGGNNCCVVFKKFKE